MKSIEEIKTFKSSDGKEQTIVTRSLGDQTHTVIEKKTDGKLQETEELFENIDHGNFITIIWLYQIKLPNKLIIKNI